MDDAADEALADGVMAALRRRQGANVDHVGAG